MIHISLFSGIGGFELAAQWMGWRNYVSCDINEFGNRVRKHYWPDCYSHNDVKTLTYETIHTELSRRYGPGWRDDDIILTGGFPCQPYSSAGKRLGKDDERHLFPEMLRVIQEIKPTYIVGENVYGLVNWSEGLVFEEVCADLESLGYAVQPVLLPASGIGAPHHRMRVWFVAHANGNESQRNSGADTSTAGEVRRDGQGNVSGELCSDGNATDTNNERLQERSITQCDDSQRRKKSSGSTEQHTSDDWKTQIPNWNNFPSAEPTICSGDDGISHRLDGITFPKWKQQSIMAYGNAVVPQLVYTIFKAIDDTKRINPSSPRPQDG
jgi:DNA (cytosine-5)-methyltransferase 1